MIGPDPVQQWDVDAGGYVATRLQPETDWRRWRRCPTCLADMGEPCAALSGQVEGGRPNGALTPLPTPHARRTPSTRHR